MNPFMLLSIAAAAFFAAAFLFCRRRTKKVFDRLSRALDEAIAGDFNESAYDESRLSQTETKLWRFLSSSKLSRGKVEKESGKIKSLISDISHQTKTPVANILLYTDLLSESEDLPPKARELAEQIRPQAEKLNFLIQSLIKASRLESGIVAVKPSANDIALLVKAAVSPCAPKASAKNIALAIKKPNDRDGNAGDLAFFDLKWTAEALYNLLDNAVKYTPPGGRVTVGWAAYEMFMRIDVSDTGPGIPESEYPKLFERFWRSAGAAGVEGVGIGLYLAREIVALQDGYIKVKSEVGKGAVFSVFLPKG
ncbi:MAG: HAMP domain-containing histidine kinase [Clostridiales bacterium]|jgi:signal transduction histidine kinase|nr:HAMP domain-containing histidine kinase [Clostridiales bacterium]